MFEEFVSGEVTRGVLVSPAILWGFEIYGISERELSTALVSALRGGGGGAVCRSTHIVGGKSVLRAI